LCTFSLSAFFAFIFGCFVLYFFKHTLYRRVLLLLLIFITVLSFVFPYFLRNPLSSYTTSISRRSDLLLASYKIIANQPLYGVGPSNFTVVSEKYTSLVYYPRFVQPVHNFFILLLSEAGLLTFLCFICFFVLSLYNAYKQEYLIASLIVFMVLGLFDHYILTMPQTNLLLWLFLSLASV
jgi:O-antigen ligase